MCGRFTITATKPIIEKRFKAKFEGGEYKPRYNAAPSQMLPVILNTEPDKIKMVRWGLQPKWMQEKTGKRDGLINVRAETLKEKHTFKSDLEKRRCLVLADGFYEWQKNPAGKKIPFRFTMKDKGLIAMAGLWEENENGKNFAIITTTPNNLLAKVHNRMPVILEEKTENRWLDDSIKNEDKINLLKPHTDKDMMSYEVSTMLNSAKFDSPALLNEPISKRS